MCIYWRGQGQWSAEPQRRCKAVAGKDTGGDGEAAVRKMALMHTTAAATSARQSPLCVLLRIAGRVCWAACGECACRRGISFRQWAGSICRRSAYVYEFALVCGVALQGHDSPDVTKRYGNIGT
jgi:hypothetical protein